MNNKDRDLAPMYGQSRLEFATISRRNNNNTARAVDAIN